MKRVNITNTNCTASMREPPRWTAAKGAGKKREVISKTAWATRMFIAVAMNWEWMRSIQAAFAMRLMYLRWAPWVSIKSHTRQARSAGVATKLPDVVTNNVVEEPLHYWNMLLSYVERRVLATGLRKLRRCKPSNLDMDVKFLDFNIRGYRRCRGSSTRVLTNRSNRRSMRRITCPNEVVAATSTFGKGNASSQSL